MALTRIDPHGKDLLLGWTEEKTKAYIETKPLAAGDLMVVASTYGGLASYELVKVINPAHGRQRRVLVSGHRSPHAGATFYRSGKNCFSPKGQTRLIPPSPEISDHLVEPGDQVVINGLYSVR